MHQIGSADLTWREFRVLVEQIPPTSDSAYAWRRSAEEKRFPQDLELLAVAVDALHGANWQRSKDGQKGANKPKPIERPGMRSREGSARIVRMAERFRRRQGGDRG